MAFVWDTPLLKTMFLWISIWGEVDVAALARQVANLTSQLADLKAQEEMKIKTEMEKMAARLKVLEEHDANTTAELKAIKDRSAIWGLIIPNVNSNGEIDMIGMVLNLTAEMKITKTEMENMAARLKVVEEHDANTTAELQAMKNRSGKRVLFLTHATQDPWVIPADGFPLKFGDVVTNIGGGYHQSTGVFHTPVAGDYLFTLQLLGSPGNEVDFQVKANGQVMSTLYIYAGTAHDMSTTTTVIHLSEGDEVNVERGWANYCSSCTIRGKPWAQFAGVLLKAD